MPAATLDKTITIALSCTDRHASAKWYKDMLGFDVIYHADEAGWSELATFTEGVTLGLGEQTEANPGNSVPVFGTPDIDASRAALEQAEVRFDGETLTLDGMAKLATFYDPDGNALMLAEDLSGAA